MDRTLQDGRARLLAVLAVLLGMIAMHGLASGHHSAAAAAAPASAPATASGPVAAAAATAPDRRDRVAGAGTHSGMHSGMTVDVSTAAAASAGVVAAVLPGAAFLSGACEDCPAYGAAALCLAVLSVGLAFLVRLLARRARASGLPAPQQRLPLLRAGPPLRLRPPDLVSQLCVSRT